MPKNKGKGGKNRRRGKNENEDEKRELVFKEDGQEYAQVLKMLGNGRLEAFCFDGVKRLCHIRGKLRKKVWINQGDIILVGLRDYQDTKADVILKYNPDEARNLKSYGELPENAKINEISLNREFGEDDDDEDIIEFGDDVDSVASDTDLPWRNDLFVLFLKRPNIDHHRNCHTQLLLHTSLFFAEYNTPNIFIKSHLKEGIFCNCRNHWKHLHLSKYFTFRAGVLSSKR